MALITDLVRKAENRTCEGKEKVLLILRPCLLKPLLNYPSDKQMGILASALLLNLAMESSIQQPLLVGAISMVYGGYFGRSS
jgi:hypothetical protein